MIKSDKFYSMNPRFIHWNSWIVAINQAYPHFLVFDPFPAIQSKTLTLLGSLTISKFWYKRNFFNEKEMHLWQYISRKNLISWCQNRICGRKMEDLFSFFFFSKKSSWRLCNAYSETLRLYRSDLFCFSLYLWIPI